ncbi:unnamed protein product [Prunus brigantina]
MATAMMVMPTPITSVNPHCLRGFGIRSIFSASFSPKSVILGFSTHKLDADSSGCSTTSTGSINPRVHNRDQDCCRFCSADQSSSCATRSGGKHLFWPFVGFVFQLVLTFCLLEPTSSDDLGGLFASLYEEGGILALVALLDAKYKAVIKQLRNFLHMGVNGMTNAETFDEFNGCLDTAMALSLLDLAKLDELHTSVAEGELMISHYVEAATKMTMGCTLDEELTIIKRIVSACDGVF